MDQKDFRSLISTAGAGSSATKRSQPSLPSPSFKPRKVEGDKPKQPPKPKLNLLTGETYQDRATARRTGNESEYTEVEKLYAHFEQRAASLQTQEERQLLREQIKYLGGDEKHSLLVKGLDFALLAQNKAKFEGDDVLESAFQHAEKYQPPEKKAERKKEEENKFRLIGFKPIGAREAKDVKYVDGKRMRKKKQKVREEEAPRKEQMAQPLPQPSKGVEKAVMPPPPSPKEWPSPAEATEPAKQEPTEPLADPPAPTPAQEDDDQDIDIFADVGGWSGLPSDDNDDEEGQAKPQAASLPSNGKRDWFAFSKTSEEPPAPEAPAPPPIARSELPPPELKSTRLQGLSDSVLPSETSRYLLEQEEAPKKEGDGGQRKRRRRGGRAKGGDTSD